MSPRIVSVQSVGVRTAAHTKPLCSLPAKGLRASAATLVPVTRRAVPTRLQAAGVTTDQGSTQNLVPGSNLDPASGPILELRDAGAVETVTLQGWAETRELDLDDTTSPGNKSHRAKVETWNQKNAGTTPGAGAAVSEGSPSQRKEGAQSEGAEDGVGAQGDAGEGEGKGWKELEHWDSEQRPVGENPEVAQQLGSQAEQKQQLMSWEEKAERALIECTPPATQEQ